jgi:CTP synthase (UTP-ammonia lyase)
MTAATNWAAENKVPCLGVCLGMQVAVIDYARNICNLTAASSVECKYFLGSFIIISPSFSIVILC